MQAEFARCVRAKRATNLESPWDSLLGRAPRSAWLPAGDFIALEPRRRSSGKRVFAWAIESAFDPATLRRDTFDVEWPPKSGQHRTFPEIDRAEWLPREAAARKILRGQAAFLDELQRRVAPEDRADLRGLRGRSPSRSSWRELDVRGRNIDPGSQCDESSASRPGKPYVDFAGSTSP